MADEKQSIQIRYYLSLALKHRWFIVLPFIISMVIGIYLAFTLPKIYSAQTLILVEPQTVPTNYVQSIVSSDIESRINTISQQIMSRTNIEKIMSEYHLLEGPQYEKMYQEDKLDQIRRQISVDVTQSKNARDKGADSFLVSFQGPDPQKVMNVANALASYFIDENLKVREEQATGTSDFLENEKAAMLKRLEEVEKALQAYRTEHMGELPEQLTSNLSILSRLQDQLNRLEERLSNAKNRMAVLREQAIATQAQGGTANSGPAETSNLEQLKSQLMVIQAKYTELHPDVVKTKKLIADLEDNLSKQAGQSNETPGLSSQTKRNVYPLSKQNQEGELEIRSIMTDIAGITNEIKLYEQRVETTPKREQELMSLTRDYNNMLESYKSLSNRKIEAEISVNMEKKQKGEQFRIIDSAKLPERPISPNMKRLFLLFVALGIGSGCGIVFLMDIMNTSFKNKEEVESYTNLPVLATVPVLVKPRIEKLRKISNGFCLVSALFSFGLFAVFAFITVQGIERSVEMATKMINIVR
ncbi:MAG: protein GumC [Proteobacteria bacterium]|nr:protein GumC [Pseudomonadota bacterium]MBU4470930.1 protein GumC [Pseudomonadota bacterium]MCG2751928.1 Wzz/FepE/Etk N-terminal domain-containing protein [Desulfobacteraceae bacterium]